MRTRLVVIMMATVMLLGVAAAPSANATSCPSCRYHITMSKVLTWLKGKHYGPNSYTEYGRATITSIPRVSTNRWSATLAMTKYPSPFTMAGSPSNRTGDVSKRSPMLMQPYDWWNPFTWNWSKIFGSVFAAVQRCVNGVTKTLAATVTTGFLLKSMIARAELAVGPEGWAVLIVGTCVTGILDW